MLLGIDGGGTKTECVLCHEDGTVAVRHFTGGCNPNDIGLEQTVRILREAVSFVCEGQKPVQSAVFGISGVLAGLYQEELTRMLPSFFPPETKVSVVCDAEIALTNGLEDREGALLICGTGSIGFARVNGVLFRVGGYGYLLDNGGSGYDLGRDAASAVLLAAEGRGAETELSLLLEQLLGMPVQDAVGKIYKGGKTLIASFAPAVFEAASHGDGVARNILKRNVSVLAEIANCLHEIVEVKTCPLVLTGGLTKQYAVWEEYFLPGLHGDFEIILPTTPPVAGAIYMAKKGYEE